MRLHRDGPCGNEALKRPHASRPAPRHADPALGAASQGPGRRNPGARQLTLKQVRVRGHPCRPHRPLESGRRKQKRRRDEDGKMGEVLGVEGALQHRWPNAGRGHRPRQGGLQELTATSTDSPQG